MKKVIAILSMFLFTFTSSTSTLVYANELQTNSKSSMEEQYEIYNGEGELLGVTNNLDEAEEYLSRLNSENSDERGSTVYQVAKTVIGKASPIILTTCVVYKVGQVVLGKAQVIDVIDLIVPVKTLAEIAGTVKNLRIYSNSITVSNPYPPHSYEGATWAKRNFYYIIGN